MNYIRAYSAVCYGAREAKAASWGTGITEDLAHVAYQVAQGDNNALGILADMVMDHDLPAADLIRRAFNGEGERDPHAWLQNWHQPREHNSLRTPIRTLFRKEHEPEFQSYPTTPNYTIVLPRIKDVDGEFFHGQKASIRASYLNHPTGHYWLLTFNTHEPHPTIPHSSIRREFLLPTTTDEIKQHAARLAEMGETFKIEADHIIRTMNTPHPEQQ